MQNNNNTSKVKKINKMFVEDLRRVRGGVGSTNLNPCPDITTTACGEEKPWYCSAC